VSVVTTRVIWCLTFVYLCSSISLSPEQHSGAFCNIAISLKPGEHVYYISSKVTRSPAEILEIAREHLHVDVVGKAINMTQRGGGGVSFNLLRLSLKDKDKDGLHKNDSYLTDDYTKHPLVTVDPAAFGTTFFGTFDEALEANKELVQHIQCSQNCLRKSRHTRTQRFKRPTNAAAKPSVPMISPISKQLPTTACTTDTQMPCTFFLSECMKSWPLSFTSPIVHRVVRTYQYEQGFFLPNEGGVHVSCEFIVRNPKDINQDIARMPQLPDWLPQEVDVAMSLKIAVSNELGPLSVADLGQMRILHFPDDLMFQPLNELKKEWYDNFDYQVWKYFESVRMERLIGYLRQVRKSVVNIAFFQPTENQDRAKLQISCVCLAKYIMARYINAVDNPDDLSDSVARLNIRVFSKHMPEDELKFIPDLVVSFTATDHFPTFVATATGYPGAHLPGADLPCLPTAFEYAMFETQEMEEETNVFFTMPRPGEVTLEDFRETKKGWQRRILTMKVFQPGGIYYDSTWFWAAWAFDDKLRQTSQWRLGPDEFPT
jgi:hypothetical protein